MKNLFINFKEYTIANKTILNFCFLIGIILYGIRIFSFSIGIDSDIYMQDPSDFVYGWNLKEGRFGLTIIQLLVFGELGLNSYAQNIISVLLLILSCFIWCYILEKNNHKNRIGLYAFVMFYLSSVVWLEIFYFTFMATACSVGIVLVPIFLILWEYSYKTKNKFIFFITIFGVAFIISIYQMLITLFCAGALILIHQNYLKNYNSSELKTSIFSLVTVTTLSLIVYFIEYKLCCNIFSVELDEYVKDKFLSFSSLKEYVKNLSFLAYTILVGEESIIYLFNNYLHFIKQENIEIVNFFCFRGSIAVFIAFILYICNIGKIIRSKFEIIFVLVSIGIILTLFIAGIVGNGSAPDRYLHAVPLVSAYLLFCSFPIIVNKRKKILWTFVCFYFLFNQCINICYLNYSDIKRFDAENNFCNTLYSRITDVYYKDSLNVGNTLTVLILGNTDLLDHKNGIRTEIVGQSATMFGNNVTKIESTLRTVPFMKALGYRIEGIKENDPRLKELKILAKEMDIYPRKNSIKYVHDVVIVKLSN